MRSWSQSTEPWPFVLGREMAGIFAVEGWQVQASANALIYGRMVSISW
mgnify:CR=1 FL=1